MLLLLLVGLLLLLLSLRSGLCVLLMQLLRPHHASLKLLLRLRGLKVLRRLCNRRLVMAR